MAITFDGPSKTVILTSGTTELDVKELWSRWVDWLLTSDNGKYLFAMEQIGGQIISIANNSYVPLYISLINGWRIRPQESNHTLNVTQGVLLTPDNSDPFVATLGVYNVRVNYQQPVAAISIATSVTGTDLVDINNSLTALQTQLQALQDAALTKTQYIALS
jgi:hypothetical protein